MTDRSERLRRARKEAELDGPAEVIERYPLWPANSYKSHENGHAPFSFKVAKKYAKAFGVRAEWLYDGKGPMRASERLGPKLLGRVAAGAEGLFDLDSDLAAAPRLDPSPDDDERIALVVEGDSMVPRFRPREIIIFGPRFDDPSSLVGQEVMAQVKGDPPQKFLKVLRRGRSEGTWTLHSINSAYDAIEDVELDWALPFEELRRA